MDQWESHKEKLKTQTHKFKEDLVKLPKERKLLDNKAINR